MHNHNPMNNISLINGWLCWTVMKFGYNRLLSFKLNLGHLYVVGFKNRMGNRRTPKLLVRLKNAKQRNCLELGARSQLSALEGVEGHAKAPGLD
jgi:hypothetical protein